MLHYVSRSNTLQSLTIVVTKGTIASARMVMLGNDKLEGHLIQLCPEVTKATRTPPRDTQRTKRLEHFSVQISHVANCTQKYRSPLRNIYHFFVINLNPKISQSTPKYLVFFVVNLNPKISQSTPKYSVFFVVNLNPKIL